MNANKPALWQADTQRSVDMYNRWYLEFAPSTYRAVRAEASEHVLNVFALTDDLRAISADALRRHPTILSVLRMATAPPIAVDRLAGLAGVSRDLVGNLEEGKLPRKTGPAFDQALNQLASVIAEMLDASLFPWLERREAPNDQERALACSVVSDRLTMSIANPRIHNAQEARQLEVAIRWLEERGYKETRVPPGQPLTSMPPGTYAVRMTVVAGKAGEDVNIPIDLVIQPKQLRQSKLPILFEAKSAGDFANVNKRRKEESDKLHHLQARFGNAVEFNLLLGGYFGDAYLQYEARAGIDWVWEHRIEDLALLGL